VLLLAGVTGVLTGLVVAGFERVVAEVLLARVQGLPLWGQAAIPTVGLLLAAACLHFGDATARPDTSDAYIQSFHQTRRPLNLRPVPARLLAAMATLGSGAPLGYEGPALYAGAAIGSGVQQRLRRLFTVEETKVLMVAGAAAGVAAIFKAPVTGLVFALEVPIRRTLLVACSCRPPSAQRPATSPSLPSSGPNPFSRWRANPPFNLVDLGGAAFVGLVAGLLARLFVAVMRRAKPGFRS
jgi:CIC family chloride channel protein